MILFLNQASGPEAEWRHRVRTGDDQLWARRLPRPGLADGLPHHHEGASLEWQGGLIVYTRIDSFNPLSDISHRSSGSPPSFRTLSWQSCWSEPSRWRVPSTDSHTSWPSTGRGEMNLYKMNQIMVAFIGELESFSWSINWTPETEIHFLRIFFSNQAEDYCDNIF